MDDKDLDIFKAIMNEPTTPEEEGQESYRVCINPEEDRLPVVSDREVLQKKLKKMQSGLNSSLIKTAEAHS